MINKSFSKFLGGLTAVSLAASPIALQAQNIDRGGPAPTGAITIPDNVIVLGDDPNNRSATAVVNGTVITGTDVDQRVALLVAASQGQLPPEELKRVKMQVLRNLIDETLQIQDAEALEIAVTNAEVNQRYAEVAGQNFNSDPEGMSRYLASIGSSEASLKRQIRGELAWSNVIRRNIVPFINVSEEEVREELARREADLGTEEFRIGEIYMNATPENQDVVLQNMQQIIQQLEQGGSFIAYARQYSESSTAARGGDLGFVRLNTLPAAMADAARRMQPGQLVGPFPIPGGFVIVFLIDKRQIGMADPRDATLSLKEISVQMEPGIDQATFDSRVSQFTTAVQSTRGCGEVDAMAANIGAKVVANDMRARSLPEPVQSWVMALQIGQTTAPFGTQGEGVRVLMLCGRDDPPQVNAPDFETVMREKEEERIDKRAQRYLRDLRNDAYIEYN